LNGFFKAYDFDGSTQLADPPVPPLPPLYTWLNANTWVDGNIAQGGDQWFYFIATSSLQYIHVAFGALDDLYVQIYDSNNNTVSMSRTNLYGSSTYAYATVTPGRIYTIRVWPYYTSGSGDYRIVFNASTTRP
jgi:hypothetical protein